MAQGAKLSTEIVTVTVSDPNGNVKEQKKSYKVVKYPVGVPTATVEASVGATINIGNFQSLKLDCRVMRNCLDSDEAITDMQKSLFTRVTNYLDAAIKTAKKNS